MTPEQLHAKALADVIIKNLNKRQIDACYCTSIEDAEKEAFSHFTPGCTIAFGGSMTLNDMGMLTALRHDPHINLIDRSKASTPEEIKKIYHDSLSADYYFMSTNAITIDGELVNVDGTGNRVAALMYGPEHVILMVGMNKVALNIDDAIDRIRMSAAPINCQRLHRDTPCAKTGICGDCLSPDCICSHTVITRRSSIPGRIKVILIEEMLGY